MRRNEQRGNKEQLVQLIRKASLGMRRGSGAMMLGIAAAAGGNIRAETSEALDIQRELRALDAQIEARLAEQMLRDNAVQGLDEKQRLAEEMLRGNADLVTKGRASLAVRNESAERERAAMQASALRARRRLEESRDAAHSTAALLVSQARERGPSDPGTFALALLYKHHKDTVEESISQGLKLEEAMAGRRQSDQILQTQHREVEAVGELPIAELRRRHKELTRRLAGMKRRVVSTEESVRRLEAQKSELNELVARLSRGEVKPEDLERIAKVYEIRSEESPEPADLKRAENTRRTSAGAETAGEKLAEVADVTSHEANALTTERDRITLPMSESIELHILAEGTVLFSGGFAGYSHLLITEHGDDWTVVYANLSHCALRAGDKVSEGESAGRYDPEEGQPGAWVEVRQDSKLRPITDWPAAPGNWWDVLRGAE